MSMNCHMKTVKFTVKGGLPSEFGRFPNFHRVFWGRDPGTLKSDIVSTKKSTIDLFEFETIKLKIGRLKLWKPTVLDSSVQIQMVRFRLLTILLYSNGSSDPGSDTLEFNVEAAVKDTPPEKNACGKIIFARHEDPKYGEGRGPKREYLRDFKFTVNIEISELIVIIVIIIVMIVIEIVIYFKVSR